MVFTIHKLKLSADNLLIQTLFLLSIFCMKPRDFIIRQAYFGVVILAIKLRGNELKTMYLCLNNYPDS